MYNLIAGNSVSIDVDLTVHSKDGTAFPWKRTYQTSLPSSASMSEMPDEFREWKWPESDKSSFSAIKKSGAIKFSNYSRGSERVQNLVSRVPACSYVNDYPGYAVKDGDTLTDKKNQIVRLVSPYYIQGDLRGFGSMFPNAPHHQFQYSYPEENSEIESVKGAVVSSMNREYDFLTEMAELKETLAYLLGILQKVRHPLKSFKDAKAVLDKKDWKGKTVEYHDAVTSLWMQYRYAIMPLVYSAQDIKSVIEHRSDLYRTERKFSKIDLNQDHPKDRDSCYFYDVVTGSTTVRSVGKARYNAQVNLRLIDSIGSNIATTAWELVPFSFVVDWFLNIGDFLSSHLGSWASLAEERHFVWSVKREYSVSTRFNYYKDERGVFECTELTWGGGIYRPAASWTYGSIQRDDIELQKKIVTSYSRETFTPSDVRLTFSPFMNWKRWLDAYVLSSGNARNALRKLKS